MKKKPPITLPQIATSLEHPLTHFEVSVDQRALKTLLEEMSKGRLVQLGSIIFSGGVCLVDADDRKQDRLEDTKTVLNSIDKYLDQIYEGTRYSYGLLQRVGGIS